MKETGRLNDVLGLEICFLVWDSCFYSGVRPLCFIVSSIGVRNGFSCTYLLKGLAVNVVDCTNTKMLAFPIRL